MAKDYHHHEFFKASLETEGRGARFTCNKCRVPLQVEDTGKCSRCGVMYCALCVLEYAVDSNDLERYLDFKHKEPSRKELLEGAFTLDEEYEVEDPEEDGIDVFVVENTPVFVQESVVEDLPPQDEWEEVEGRQLVKTQFITEEPLGDLHSLFDDIQDELNAINEQDGSKPLYEPRKQLKEERGDGLAPPRRKGLTGLWDDLKNWMDD